MAFDLSELVTAIGELTASMNRLAEVNETMVSEFGPKLDAMINATTAREESESNKQETQSNSQQGQGQDTTNIPSILQSGFNSVKAAVANIGTEIAKTITEPLNDGSKRIADSILVSYRAGKEAYTQTSELVTRMERAGQGMDYSEVQKLYNAHQQMEARAIRGQIKVDKVSGRTLDAQLKTEALKSQQGRGGMLELFFAPPENPQIRPNPNSQTSGG